MKLEFRLSIQLWQKDPVFFFGMELIDRRGGGSLVLCRRLIAGVSGVVWRPDKGARRLDYRGSQSMSASPFAWGRDACARGAHGRERPGRGEGEGGLGKGGDCVTVLSATVHTPPQLSLPPSPPSLAPSPPPLTLAPSTMSGDAAGTAPRCRPHLHGVGLAKQSSAY